MIVAVFIPEICSLQPKPRYPQVQAVDLLDPYAPNSCSSMKSYPFTLSPLLSFSCSASKFQRRDAKLFVSVGLYKDANKIMTLQIEEE